MRFALPRRIVILGSGALLAQFPEIGEEDDPMEKTFDGDFLLAPTDAKIVALLTEAIGQPDWKILVARRSKFPFDADSPLAVSGTPETREYRAVGVLNDEEIGQPSDIVSVVYGG